jgi:hypothetical protein
MRNNQLDDELKVITHSTRFLSLDLRQMSVSTVICPSGPRRGSLCSTHPNTLAVAGTYGQVLNDDISGTKKFSPTEPNPSAQDANINPAKTCGRQIPGRGAFMICSKRNREIKRSRTILLGSTHCKRTYSVRNYISSEEKQKWGNALMPVFFRYAMTGGEEAAAMDAGVCAIPTSKRADMRI